MIDVIKHSGMAGLLALVLTAAIAIAIILVACLSKRRRALVVMFLVALFPLVAGLLGTGAGYAQVRSAVVEHNVDRAMIEVGRAEARGATYVGLGCSVLLWIICGVVSVARKGPAARGSGKGIE